MKFVDENYKLVHHKAVEIEEQEQAKKYITEDCVVLELGARYGTISCIISKILSNSQNLVAVEPDSTVWNCLENNMFHNFCDFHIVKGAISNTPLTLRNPTPDDRYAMQTIRDNNGSVPCFTLKQIEEKYNLKFNTLVADCEGFLETFFDENPQMYEQLNLILFEKDCPNVCNYDKIESKLIQHRFKKIVSGFHEVWKK